MSVQLNHVIPWGRTLDEYRHMFSLTDEDLQKRILGCADGPASFNAEMTAVNHFVVSIDPLYEFSAVQIEQRVQKTYPDMITQVAQTQEDYVWKTMQSPTHLAEVRLEAMARFLADFEVGKSDGRYLPLSLPFLPFADGEFDLALCSHFLFLYSDHFSFDFHLTAVHEMMRVANECRIFPLLDLNCQISVHLEPLIVQLTKAGFEAKAEPVNYEFQRGGNKMLRICKVDR